MDAKKTLPELNKLLDKTTSKTAFKDAIRIVLNCNGYKFIFCLCFIVCLALGIWVGYSDNTILFMQDIVSISQNICLAIFAVFFTGYTLFQALSSKGVVATLLLSKSSVKLHSDKEQTSFYQLYNLYFLGISYLGITLIGINFFLEIFLKVVPEDFYLPLFSYKINNFCASLFIVTYLMLNIKLILEVKSFLFNLYQCFLISDAHKLNED